MQVTAKIDKILYDIKTQVFTFILKNGATVLQLTADANTKGIHMAGALYQGDTVDVVYDSNHYIISIIKPGAAAATTAPTSMTKSARVFMNVFFHGYTPLKSGDPRGIAIIHVATQIGGTVYDAYITKSTVLDAGLINLKEGSELRIEYDNNAVVWSVEVVEDLELELEALADSLLVEKGPADWVNLCTRDMMFRCGGSSRDDRKRCHFHDLSQSRYNECSHNRGDSFGYVCDCIDAHRHLVEYGSRGTDHSVTEREEPVKSYDETLKETFGHKV